MSSMASVESFSSWKYWMVHRSAAPRAADDSRNRSSEATALTGVLVCAFGTLQLSYSRTSPAHNPEWLRSCPFRQVLPPGLSTRVLRSDGTLQYLRSRLLRVSLKKRLGDLTEEGVGVPSLLTQFAYLQLLDLLTTLTFLASGVGEANPLIRFLIAGPDRHSAGCWPPSSSPSGWRFTAGAESGCGFSASQSVLRGSRDLEPHRAAREGSGLGARLNHAIRWRCHAIRITGLRSGCRPPGSAAA